MPEIITPRQVADMSMANTNFSDVTDASILKANAFIEECLKTPKQTSIKMPYEEFKTKFGFPEFPGHEPVANVLRYAGYKVEDSSTYRFGWLGRLLLLGEKRFIRISVPRKIEYEAIRDKYGF